MARYEDFSVSLLRVGSASQTAAGNPSGSAVSANGNASSSSIIYAYLAPTVTTANTELVITSTGVQGLAVGDAVVFAPVGASPALNGAGICRAYCATAGTLSVGFLSGAAVTPATGMYRFLVLKPN